MVKATRSPNYPSMSLEAAVKKTHELFGHIGRHKAGVGVVVGHLGYKPTSSSARAALAALRAYGLLADEADGGKDQMVRISSRGLDLEDYKPTDSEFRKALRDAALSPKLYKEVRTRYGANMPSDDEVRRFLIREREFNDGSVEQFLKEYKATMAYARVDEADTIVDKKPVEIGSFVQWTSAGVDQFPTSRRLAGMSDDGKWGFVEDSETGIPMAELTTVDPPQNPDTTAGKAPRNPNFQPPKPSGPSIRFPLSDDNIFELRLDAKISKEDFKRLKQLIDLSEASLVK